MHLASRLKTTVFLKNIFIKSFIYRFNECEREYFQKVNNKLLRIDSKDGFNIFYDKFCKENGPVSDKKGNILQARVELKRENLQVHIYLSIR